MPQTWLRINDDVISWANERWFWWRHKFMSAFASAGDLEWVSRACWCTGLNTFKCIYGAVMFSEMCSRTITEIGQTKGHCLPKKNGFDANKSSAFWKYAMHTHTYLYIMCNLIHVPCTKRLFFCKMTGKLNWIYIIEYAFLNSHKDETVGKKTSGTRPSIGAWGKLMWSQHFPNAATNYRFYDEKHGNC